MSFKVANIKTRKIAGTVYVSRMKQYNPGDEKPSEEPTLYAELEQESLDEHEEGNNTLDAQ